MSEKRYVELTDAEIKQRSKLTPKEQEAVDRFIYAARLLPRSICVEVEDNEDGWNDGNLIVSKRITRGSCVRVAKLNKKSLKF